MNWSNLNLNAANFIGWAASKAAAIWKYKALVLAGVALLLVLIIAGWVRSCNDQKTEKKIEQTRENIVIDKVEANQLTNEKQQVNIEVGNAQEKVNQSGNNFNISVNRQSNSFAGVADAVFCSRFCEDDTCREWRKTHFCRER